ncbi:MAG: hypothetical protein A3I61_06595 [Acidobacteria bacterium RIFCSPLOWO2_02_FULL_68_18]|nr:MAG: hypothetical protein A3I61_06595 [Acidobacteria bacterium RIFCSPLOWO2_02_FULL_68_18]OFW50322.1 MAG: hypothetical protein A3G77_07590 [Acidobacteria bacterium RIFCSPLOWO2_12_FULL_68_19]
MKSSRTVAWLLAAGALLALPSAGRAQEAVITGRVADSTGGVLPGVTVTAVHEATGNTFLGVSDETGIYRIPVRIGGFRITAELQGFATVTRSGVTVLVGQTVTIDVQMVPSSFQESVTVTAEAPLIDTRQSTVGANLDSRQLSEIPLSGRNWTELVILMPGSRANEVGTNGTGGPVARTGRSGGTQGTYQVNIDGQQVTQTVAGTFTNPNFSRESIAEFQFISNRFDAAQGRSAGIQVNAVTKSGTNAFEGSFSGYFRNSKWGSPDFIRRTILPYSNQQIVATFGGPIKTDRLHFFGHYEVEREPRVVAFTTPWPSFNQDLRGNRMEHKAGARVDWDMGGQRRLAVSSNFWSQMLPNRFDLNSSTDHPSATTRELARMQRVNAQLTQVLSNRAVNVVNVGVYRQTSDETSYIGDDKVGKIQFNSALSVGPGLTDVGRTPFRWNPTTYTFRDDVTLSFNARGRHDLKFGGEYLFNTISDMFWCNYCRGWLDARGGAVPRNIEQIFPVWNDPSTWRLDDIPGSVLVRYRKAFGDPHMEETKHMPGVWIQDDWSITSKLTLNVGVRYDVEVGAFAENLGLEVRPFLPPNRKADRNNVAPRVGFAYSMTDTTVVRGGYGRFYAQMFARDSFYTHALMQTVIPEIRYDGRPNFASNPFNGPEPTYEQVVARTCPATNNAPGCYRLDLTRINSPSMDIPYSHQSSVGVQQQIGTEIAVTADFVYTGLKNTEIIRNVNLTYNPATGVNYPFTDLSRRAFPDWGLANVVRFSQDGYMNDYALQTGFTKRFSRGYQLSGTYTAGMVKDADPPPVSATLGPDGYVRYAPLPFQSPPDFGGQYTYAVTDQRHRATLNGVWELPYDFQLSGLYFYGSGMRFAAAFGGDTRNVGSGGSNRFNPATGEIVPRNSFVGKPLHRVDTRILRRFSLGRGVAVDGIVEVFNLFNHRNYGNYVTTINAANFGAPVAQDNVAYKPRQFQLGFRATF